MTIVFTTIIVTALLSIIYFCKKTNFFKDEYLNKLYRKREIIRLHYDLEPTEENKNELKKINREIDIHLYTDG